MAETQQKAKTQTLYMLKTNLVSCTLPQQAIDKSENKQLKVI